MRRSGGFLLDHALPQRRDGSIHSSKRRPDPGSLQLDGKGKAASLGGYDGGSLPANDKGKAPSSRLSTGSSVRASSPLSQEMRFNEETSTQPTVRASAEGPSEREGKRSDEPTSTQPTLDPTQLVQMALSLSEGRRRHVSAGLTVPAVSADTRRVRSAGGPTFHVTPGSPLGNDAVRPSSGPPATGTSSAHSRDAEYKTVLANGRRAPHGHDYPQDPAELMDQDDQEETVEYHFSPATINRAERAKKFFELATEYRRLMAHLPPLKPDSSAPGNYTFSTLPSPGNMHPQISRIRSNDSSKYDLGREYNPLQLLRNRRIRHREQRPLDPQPDAFDNVERVKSYIDQVETASQHPEYREAPHVVNLPAFRRGSHTEETPPPPTTRTHKRTDTAVSKTFRPIGDWSFTPSELFADALWLEQNDNKTLIENRYGTNIFVSSDRMSIDSARSLRQSRESARPSLERTHTTASTIGTADEGAAKKPFKRRKMLSLRNVDNAARKHIFRQRPRSGSDSSDSSAERRKRTYKHGNNFSEDNVAPLDRHMRQLIHNETSTSAISPAIISPDRWDRFPGQPQNASIPDNLSFNGDEEDHLGPSKPTHTRNTSSKTDEPISPGRPSFDDSTAPSSPNVPSFIPSFGMSLSPPPSRSSSPERKSGFFHTDSKEIHKIQETDFAASRNSFSNKPNGDLISPQRSSFESARPSLLKRNKTTTSVSSDRPTNHDRRNSKDTAVARFFKGGRIGDLVRAESSAFGDVIWKKKPPKDKDALSASDTSDQESVTADEDDDYQTLKRRPADISRTSISNDAKPKYHTPGLPTFKSQNAHSEEGDVAPDQLRRESNRSSRIGRLAPPRIQLPNGHFNDDDDNDDDESPKAERPELRKASTASTITEERRGSDTMLSALRKNKSAESSVFNLGLPGSISTRPNKTYMTALANAAASRRPSLQGKRQWSISDTKRLQLEKEMQRVTVQDIARVRTLFLASGVKAHQLIQRAHTTVDPPSDFLITASKIAKEQFSPVEAREEFVLAAKLLSRKTFSTTKAMQSDLDRFRSDRAPALHLGFEQLKHQVDEKLMPVIQGTTDEAEAFNVEITTHQTLAVKQVHDAIDGILRSRRRRLRILKKAGFAVLEWTVLGLLWVVWFVVVIIRLVRKMVMGVVGTVRWCLWL